MGLVGRFSYKFLVGGIFAVLIFGLVGSQQAMAGVEEFDLDIRIDKCVTLDRTDIDETGEKPTGTRCLTLEGSARSVIAKEGDTVFFRIDAIGLTPTGVEVTDLLSDGLKLLDFDIVEPGSPPSGPFDSVSGIWSIGKIAEGGTRSLLIVAKVEIGTCGTILENIAFLSKVDQNEGPPTNNQASASVEVIPEEEECPSLPTGGSDHEPPTIGMNLRGNYQVVPEGICIDGQCWTVIENFHEDFELVEMLTSTHTISNTIYCSKGVNTCNHITLSGAPYGTDINSALWKVSADKNLLGELTVTKDDPDGYLGVATCTSQVQAEKYWFTTCTIDFNLGTDGGIMLGVQVWDTYGGVRNFYFNDGIEIIDTYGYPSVDTEYEPPLDVPRLCLADDPDKRTSCAFAEKLQLEIERAERLLTE